MARHLGAFGQFVCFIVLVTFCPTSIGVWNFIPCQTGAAWAEVQSDSEARITVDQDSGRLTVREHDLSLPISDSESLSFDRFYVNENGAPQESKTARLGLGWRHSLEQDTDRGSISPNDSAIKFFYEGEADNRKITKVQAGTNADAKLVLRYDDSDRLTKVSLVEKRDELQSVTYRYDDAGQLVEASHSDGHSVMYRYENIGPSVVMSKITDDSNNQTEIGWLFSDDAGGRMAASIEVTLPNGEKQVYERQAAAADLNASL